MVFPELNEYFRNIFCYSSDFQKMSHITEPNGHLWRRIDLRINDSLEQVIYVNFDILLSSNYVFLEKVAKD